VLSQGGKFAFVLLATDAIPSVIGESNASLITFAAALSVALLKETQQCVS